MAPDVATSEAKPTVQEPKVLDPKDIHEIDLWIQQRLMRFPKQEEPSNGDEPEKQSTPAIP